MSDIFYRKNGSEFELVHQLDRHEEILYRGKEVAIGFTYDPEQDKGIQFTTHRHGSPETVQQWVERTNHAIQRSRFLRQPLGLWARPHTIASDQWDVEDLNRIISTTGYLGVALKKLGINLIDLTA